MSVIPEKDLCATIPEIDCASAAPKNTASSRLAPLNTTSQSGCQTWLMTSDVDQWITSLERIRALDVDWICPGHGPVVSGAAVRFQA